MTYQKFNKDKANNIKMGQFYDNKTMLEESAALTKEESKDIEVNMLRESMSVNVKKERQHNNTIMQRQKYLNESNWYALKSYITKLAVTQAKGLYDFKALKEEYGMDPEAEIEAEVEEELKVELPLSIQGDNGTIIPIKIEVTPETADVVSAVVGIMDKNNGADKTYMDTEQVEASADEAMEQLPEEVPEAMPEVETANDVIADETIDIITKDQEMLADLKARMDQLEAVVSSNEQELGLAGEEEVEELIPGEEDDGLVEDPETGLLVDPETGEVYDPQTRELIEESYHREYKPQTVLEVLAFKKANKMLKESHTSYNRDLSIVGGINSLIILESINHVFGRKVSYPELRKQLKIK